MIKKPTTRRQHYVWQKYLEPWKINNKVWCERNNKVFNTSTKNIVLEKDMYKFHELNDLEKKVLKMALIDYRKDVENLVNQEMSLLESISVLSKVNPGKLIEVLADDYRLKVSQGKNEINIDKIADLLKNNKNPKLRKQLNHLVKNFRIQCGEDLMTLNENSGHKFIDNLLNSDICFFREDNPEMFDFYIYILSQYFRTAKIKKRLTKNFKIIEKELKQHFKSNLNIDGKKIYSHLVHALITKSSISMYEDKNYRIILMKSNSKHFITSDQPVMNIDEELDKNGYNVNMELLMAISPIKAIKITKKIKENIITEIDDKTVSYINNLIKKHSYNTIIGDSSNAINLV